MIPNTPTPKNIINPINYQSTNIDKTALSDKKIEDKKFSKETGGTQVTSINDSQQKELTSLKQDTLKELENKNDHKRINYIENSEFTNNRISIETNNLSQQSVSEKNSSTIENNTNSNHRFLTKGKRVFLRTAGKFIVRLPIIIIFILTLPITAPIIIAYNEYKERGMSREDQ